MSIEIGSKWVKDGEVVEVLSNPFNYFYPYEDLMNMKEREKCVWFMNDEGNHVLTERDFLEQYKPYEPVYEYQYFYQYKTTQSANSRTHEYYKDDEEFCRKNNIQQIDYQRLDFTKRERK